MKTYRVHVHDHLDQGRWLAQADFKRWPADEAEVRSKLPVLNRPGRYEVNVNVVQGGKEIRWYGWLEGTP